MEFNPDDQINTEDKKIYHKSAGGFVFYEDSNDHRLFVALIKPKGKDKYFIPKGHLKKGEKSLEAAKREIVEELSLSVEPGYVADIGNEEYSFTLDGGGEVHYKSVDLFLFKIDSKEEIAPPSDEDIDEVAWLEFYDALEKIAYDKENLLRARQLFYYHKPVSDLTSFTDVKSLTVGVPTYNGASTIYETLESIYQSLKGVPDNIEKEVVVCTDHCEDNTAEIIKKFFFEREEENVSHRLVDNEGSQGKVSVLNKIASESQSGLLCFIDDDVSLSGDCIFNLIKALIDDEYLRCSYAWWHRKEYSGKSPWRRFWHWILGVKFDLPLFDTRPEYMRGACMMFRRENYVRMGSHIINEDQFLQYIYWPQTKEVEGSKIYFNSVSSLTDYYKRFIRIKSGSNQLEGEFSEDRVEKCLGDLHQKINFDNIRKSPARLKYPFYFYRFIRYFVNLMVKVRLKINEEHEWHRINQN